MDVVAVFRPEVRFGLVELVDMEDELSAIVGKKADLHEFPGLRPWMQEEVAKSMEVYYESEG